LTHGIFYVKESAVSVITACTLLVSQVESLPATLQTAGLHVQGSGGWQVEVAVPAAALEVGSPSASDRPQGRPFMVEQAIAATAAPKAGPVLGMDGRRWEMLSDGSDEDEPDAGAGMGFSFDRATYGGSLRCRYV
jgi:hypothetical protein